MEFEFNTVENRKIKGVNLVVAMGQAELTQPIYPRARLVKVTSRAQACSSMSRARLVLKGNAQLGPRARELTSQVEPSSQAIFFLFFKFF